MVPKAEAYSVEEQLTWDVLPVEKESAVRAKPVVAPQEPQEPFSAGSWGATVPPWSAAHAYTNLYGPKSGPTTATVVGNFKVNEAGTENETHHIVLDLGAMPFPVLEGQS